MKKGHFMKFVGLVLVVVMVIWWIWSTKTDRKVGGMQEFARNPKAWDAMSKAFASRDELLERAPNMSDEELTQGLETFFGNEENAITDWKLVFEKIGPRGERVLLKGLRDPRCDSTTPSKVLKAPTAFESFTHLLAEIANRSVISTLQEWRNSEDERKRNHAIWCIAMTGLDEAIPSTVEALRSSKQEDRQWAQGGIDWAISYKNVRPLYGKAIFDQISSMLAGVIPDSSYEDGRLSEVLLKLDAEKGRAVLLSSEVLKLENPLLPEVLEALRKASVVVPEEKLRVFLDASRGKTEYIPEKVWAQSVRAMVRAAPGSAKPEIDEALKSSDRTVRREAIEGLRELLDLPSPFDLEWGKDDLSSFPVPVQHIMAALEFDMEVRNGGLTQYFFNSSGENWRTALDGFKAMGATVCDDILTKAIQVIDPRMKSSDRKARLGAIGDLDESKEKQLNALDSRYYKEEKDLDLCIVRCMEQHAAVVREFAKRKTSKSSK